MEKKTPQQIFQNALEKERLPSEPELWPAVKERLVARNHPLFQQGQKMTPNLYRRTAFAALGLALTLVILLITPQGQAFAKNLFNFFTHTESDTISVQTAAPQTWVDVTPGVPAPTATPLPSDASFAECGSYDAPTCSIETIRGKVNFTVKEIGALPADVFFVGATGSPEQVQLSYRKTDRSLGLMLFVEPWDQQQITPSTSVGASAVIEKAQVGSHAGEYVRGSFDTSAGDTPAVWKEDSGLETLRWVEDGSLYSLIALAQPLYGKDALLALATTLTLDPVAKLPLPTPEEAYGWDPRDVYRLSIADAETSIGIQLKLPKKLPQNLTLIGAATENDPALARVFYQFETPPDVGPSTDGLTLSMQVSPDPITCFLCRITVGSFDEQRKTVSESANLEAAQVWDVTGQYVEGVWSGTDCCGWQWDTTSYVKTLRWWRDGIAYELMYFGVALGKADLLAIAASME